MRPDQSSRTAEFMALFRALETTRPADRRLFDDPFAARFVSAPLRRAVRCSATTICGTSLRGLIDLFWPGARSSGVARTRLIDDWVRGSVENGSRQVVVLGAGFDSRAWRMPALATIPIFEVDRAATALEKRRRVGDTTGRHSNVAAVAVDFDRDSLPDALEKAGFDPRVRTVVVWEGVTNYLTDAAVHSVLAWAGSLAAGGQLIFTYVDRKMLDEPASFAGAEKILRTVERAGEPWTFGFRPDALPECLQSHGLLLDEDLGADDYRARYFGAKARKMRGYAFYRAVLATVVGRHA
jgi:methyltransferase (TIGR00027 family)